MGIQAARTLLAAGAYVRFTPHLPRLQEIKDKQIRTLAEFRSLACRNQWSSLQKHEGDGFDWWMFPIERPSASYGHQYTVTARDIGQLKNDPDFMSNYREGVILVAKSWGWDLETNTDIRNNFQFWSGYQVRLGKMLDSVTLFNQEDLRKGLLQFIDEVVKKEGMLEPWIEQLAK